MSRAAAATMEKYNVAANGAANLKLADLKELVKWKLFYGKQGTKIPSRKADLLELWNKLPLPVAEEKWTSEDQVDLFLLTTTDVNIEDTALGEEHAKTTAQLVGGLESGLVPADAVKALQTALDAHNQRQSASRPSATTQNVDNIL